MSKENDEKSPRSIALEARRKKSERCFLPIIDEFYCKSECDGCIFFKKMKARRGVSGTEIFDEYQLTACPKGWEPTVYYNGRGAAQDSNVIRDHGWCHKCKEKLEECSCYKKPSLF